MGYEANIPRMNPLNGANASIPPGCGEAMVSKHGFSRRELLGARAGHLDQPQPLGGIGAQERRELLGRVRLHLVAQSH